jgi:hypothetical protein
MILCTEIIYGSRAIFIMYEMFKWALDHMYE